MEHLILDMQKITSEGMNFDVQVKIAFNDIQKPIKMHAHVRLQ